MRPSGHIQMDGLLWMGMGAAIIVGSIILSLGTFRAPGSGLMPFLVGSVLTLLGLVLVLQAAFHHGGTGASNLTGLVKGLGKERIYSLIALGIYALLLEPLGFIITNFLFLFLLFEILEPKKWVKPILISLIAVLLSYLVFNVWLRINFPKGIFRIG